MQQQIAQQQSIWKINWKYSLLILIPCAYFYPKPFIYLLKPFIRPFIKQYHKQTNLDSMPQILLLSNSNSPLLKTTINKMTKQYIYVIDIFDKNVIQSKTSRLWAQVIINKLSLIGINQPVVLINGYEEVLKRIQLSLFQMQSQQIYKITSFENHLHILVKNTTKGYYQRSLVEIKESRE